MRPAAIVAEDKAKTVDFARDVQPILKETCHKCHGPEKQKGKLRLDSKAAAMKGGDDGPVIIPGHADKSPLYLSLIIKDEEERMPQKADPLAADKIQKIRDWINQGAVWPD